MRWVAERVKVAIIAMQPSMILSRALISAKIPARLEPSGLLRLDGKRPDGVTIVLVWDATCPDTLPPPIWVAMAAGEIAAMVDARKCSKYSALPTTHFFVPLAIETPGAISPKSLKTLGKCLRRESGDSHAAANLLQRLPPATLISCSTAWKCYFHLGGGP